MQLSLTDISHFVNYSNRLQNLLANENWNNVSLLAESIYECWRENRRIFICGNGGSAGNAIHLANDFLYGIAKKTGKGAKISSLCENSAVITCLANDVGYQYIFSEQLAVQAQRKDILIVLSGSGNSSNIINVLKKAKEIDVNSFAILGFDGGECLKLANHSIHFEINDMQISEDLQLIVGHMVMQWLFNKNQVDSI